ncbi:C10 family peptidase, partial [Bacteroidota bacterium]
VAMGQIMWYWQWPKNNSYRSYDWDLIPNELTNSSSLAEGEMISFLLHDIGNACKMDNNIEYFCTFSWTMMYNMEDAFVNDFKYKAAEKKVKSEWDYPGAWEDLIRSEIAAGRPVVYYGERALVNEEKHYFVCDGYDSSDPDYFHFNFGWGHLWYVTYNTSFQYLDDLTPGSNNFNKNHKAIVGISPSRNTVTDNIYDVSYSTVNSLKHEVAKYNISLPSNNETLTVKDWGQYMLTAGNSISLNPGFSVKNGSIFKARIEDIGNCVSGISVPIWYNAFTPNGDGINETLWYNVYNADTWEFQVFDRNGYSVFQSAGVIENNKAEVWKGEESETGNYYCLIKFRNSCGEVLTKDLAVLVIHGKEGKSESINYTVANKEIQMNDLEDLNLEVDFNFAIYPNPSNGVFKLNINNKHLNYGIKIYNLTGELIYQKANLNSQEQEIDLSDRSKGIYVVKVEIGNEIFANKILIE